MNERTEFERLCELLAARYPERKGKVIFHYLSGVSDTFVLKSWLKQIGDAVQLGDAVAVLECESCIVEVESYQAGVLTEHMFACGDVVQPGLTLCRIRNET